MKGVRVGTPSGRVPFRAEIGVVHVHVLVVVSLHVTPGSCPYSTKSKFRVRKRYSTHWNPFREIERLGVK